MGVHKKEKRMSIRYGREDGCFPEGKGHCRPGRNGSGESGKCFVHEPSDKEELMGIREGNVVQKPKAGNAAGVLFPESLEKGHRSQNFLSKNEKLTSRDGTGRS